MERETVYTPYQAAEILGLSNKGKIYALIRSREIGAYKYGNGNSSIAIPEKEIIKYKERMFIPNKYDAKKEGNGQQ